MLKRGLSSMTSRIKRTEVRMTPRQSNALWTRARVSPGGAANRTPRHSYARARPGGSHSGLLVCNAPNRSTATVALCTPSINWSPVPRRLTPSVPRLPAPAGGRKMTGARPRRTSSGESRTKPLSEETRRNERVQFDLRDAPVVFDATGSGEEVGRGEGKSGCFYGRASLERTSNGVLGSRCSATCDAPVQGEVERGEPATRARIGACGGREAAPRHWWTPMRARAGAIE